MKVLLFAVMCVLCAIMAVHGLSSGKQSKQGALVFPEERHTFSHPNGAMFFLMMPVKKQKFNVKSSATPVLASSGDSSDFASLMDFQNSRKNKVCSLLLLYHMDCHSLLFLFNRMQDLSFVHPVVGPYQNTIRAQ